MLIEEICNSTSTNVTETDSASLAIVPLLIDEHTTTNGNGTNEVIDGPSGIDNRTELLTTVGPAPSAVLQAGMAIFSNAGEFRISLTSIRIALNSQIVANVNRLAREFEELHNAMTASLSNVGGSRNYLGPTGNALVSFRNALANRILAILNEISTEFGGGNNVTINSDNSDSSDHGFGDISGSDIITEAENYEPEDSLYECNICLDTAENAVVSMCGHLFCWSCLCQMLTTRPNRKLCPVCKAYMDKDAVIPLFGRNCVNKEDPRDKVPPRPAEQRVGFILGNRFLISFEVGAFPIPFFTSLNFGIQDKETLLKFFLYLAFISLVWILFF